MAPGILNLMAPYNTVRRLDNDMNNVRSNNLYSITVPAIRKDVQSGQNYGHQCSKNFNWKRPDFLCRFRYLSVFRGRHFFTWCNTGLGICTASGLKDRSSKRSYRCRHSPLNSIHVFTVYYCLQLALSGHNASILSETHCISCALFVLPRRSSLNSLHCFPFSCTYRSPANCSGLIYDHRGRSVNLADLRVPL